MSFKYEYQPKYLIKNGIGLLFILTLGSIGIFGFLWNYIFLTSSNRIIAVIIVWTILEPIFIGWGIYVIYWGRTKFSIIIDENRIKEYRNQKLKSDMPRVHLQRVIYTKRDLVNVWVEAIYEQIKFYFRNGKTITIYDEDEERFPIIHKFIEDLEDYCRKYQIEFKID